MVCKYIRAYEHTCYIRLLIFATRPYADKNEQYVHINIVSVHTSKLNFCNNRNNNDDGDSNVNKNNTTIIIVLKCCEFILIKSVLIHDRFRESSSGSEIDLKKNLFLFITSI